MSRSLELHAVVAKEGRIADDSVVQWKALAVSALGLLDDSQDDRQIKRWNDVAAEMQVSHSAYAHRTAIGQYRDLWIADRDLADAWREYVGDLLHYQHDGVRNYVRRIEDWATTDVSTVASRAQQATIDLALLLD